MSTKLSLNRSRDLPRSSSWKPKTFRGGGLQRIKSLQAELMTSSQPIVLVSGQEGAGKSAFLRGLAFSLANAIASDQVPSWLRAGPLLMPLYVDLRDLEWPDPGDNEPDAIRRLILGSCQVDSLTTLLRPRALSGAPRWLLILDAFDEIPELLSAAGSDNAIERYAMAIQQLAEACWPAFRIVVATREDSEPKRPGWHRYRLLSLSKDRCLAITHERLPDERAQKLLGQLYASRLTGWTKSPLLLDLICMHFKGSDALPTSVHAAFESFIDRCLAKASDVLVSHRLTRAQLLDIAERLAFWMTGHNKLGLAVDLEQIEEAVRTGALELACHPGHAVEALVELGIGRGPRTTGIFSDRFAFRHRRLQAYFATCGMRGDEVPTADELLTDEEWRDTAIALLQTGSTAAEWREGIHTERGRECAAPLLRRAAELLEAAIEEIRDLVPGSPPSTSPQSSPSAASSVRRPSSHGRRVAYAYSRSCRMRSPRPGILWLLRPIGCARPPRPCSLPARSAAFERTFCSQFAVAASRRSRSETSSCPGRVQRQVTGWMTPRSSRPVRSGRLRPR